MKTLLTTIVFILNVNIVYALELPSAKRYINEDFKDAQYRVASSIDEISRRNRRSTTDDTFSTKRDLSSIDFSVLPQWTSEQLEDAFKRGRDSRFIPMGATQTRRLSWLYPQDGCFVRADLLSKVLEKYQFPETKKLFVFGNLEVDTPNARSGVVRWWYHVAVVASSGGQTYVFDPAINAENSLRLDDWIANLGSHDLSYSLCDKDTYTPFDSCSNPNPQSNQELLQTAQEYLNREEINIQELGRSASEITNMPPWRVKLHKWGENDRQGNIGEIFKYDNPYSNKIEYFKLSRLGHDGRYWNFPTDQQNNWYWQYLGNNFDENFIKDMKSWGENNRQGNIGEIFKYNNPYSNQTDYFELFRLESDGKYWYFPTDQQNNWYWQYLENGYPDTFQYFEQE